MNKAALVKRFPQSFTEEFKSRYESLLEESSEEYIDFMSIFFAYMVITDRENTASSGYPLDLKEYPTLLDLLNERKLVTVGDSAWEVKNGELFLPFTSFSQITWGEHFTIASQEYITEKVDELFLSAKDGSKSYISEFLSDKEMEDIDAVQTVLDHIVELMGGEAFFGACASQLQNILNAVDPRFIFAKGEEKALELVKSAKEQIEKEMVALPDFGDMMVRATKLWERINGRYFLEFGEELPKGQIGREVYDQLLDSVLDGLQHRGVTEIDIRELTALGPQKFTAGVMKELFEYKFDRGVEQ